MSAKSRKGSLQRVSSMIASGTFGGQLGERLKELVIWQNWQQIVGKGIAERARPLRLSGGVLTVTVISPAWMQELSYMKGELVSKLNFAIGDERIKEIVFKAGSFPRSAVDKEERVIPLNPVTPEQKAEIDSIVSEVEDEELREELRRLMTSHYQHVK